MKYFELICTAYLKRDIPFKEGFDIISKYISYSMAQTKDFKELHDRKGYKLYSFGNFYPPESEQIYKKGQSYKFILRSLDEKFIDTMAINMRENINNPNFLVVEAQKRAVKQFFITELYSATPVIVTTENNLFWTMQKDGDILKLQKQLHDNLEKKYQTYYNEKINTEQNFIQLLEIKNRHPQNIYVNKRDESGKTTSFRFFGNKFRIVPNEDKASQKLAFTALACGLGEKNSFGGGFCLSRGIGL